MVVLSATHFASGESNDSVSPKARHFDPGESNDSVSPKSRHFDPGTQVTGKTGVKNEGF